MDTATSEVVWRLGAFLAVFAVMALLERARPKRALVLPRLMRWRTNLAIVVIDSLAVRLASYHYIANLGEVGIKFFAFAPGMLHEKVMLIDDTMASVGTANFDNRSFRLNFDVTAVLLDEGFASVLENRFEMTFEQSEPTDTEALMDRPLYWRLGVNFARLLSPIL